MTRLVLIRHGTTEWNKEGRYCGRKDVALSTDGRAQAKKLGARLAAVSFSKIYCSDRKRALQTVRLIFGKSGIVKLKGLREIDFGVLEGLKHDEIMEKYAPVYRKWLDDCYRNDIPEAERMPVFKKRVEKTLKKIALLNNKKTVAVVCHGGVIGVFVSGILKSGNFWKHIPSAASMTVVEYVSGKPKVKKFNDTAHLKASHG